MSEKIPKLLPLGTAVKIKNDTSLYIIISRGFQKKNGEIISGYAGIPHPYGQNDKYKTMIISSEKIIKVVHQGHEDELDIAYTKKQIENIVEAPQNTNDAIKESDLKKDTNDVSIETESEHPYDPFYELKKKYKSS